jgi:small GTP-binding protein
MLEELQGIKRELAETMTQIGEIAGASGNESIKRALLEERLPRLEEERFNLVVLGEFNHGKTTFVNALLGKTVLPVGVTPTTAVIHHLQWAETPRAAAITTSGERIDLSLDELKSFAVDGARAAGVRYLEVGYPSSILKSRVVLVDTPGVNDLNLQRAEITYSYIPRSDAVIFLLDAGQILKESERIFIEERLLKQSRDKIFFVVNKIDLLTEPEREEALKYARENLASIIPEPQVFGISSTMALLGEGERSGLPALVARLGDFLGAERGRVLLDNAVTDAERSAASLQRHMIIRSKSLALDEKELDRRIGAVEDELRSRGRRVEELESRITDASDLLKSEVAKDLREFGEAFRRSLADDIEKSSADDIKKYLAGYIQDCFKQWTELEGEKVTSRLELLAEETISVVNEDVKGAVAKLADQMGIDRKVLDLNIDTLAYDVGVFALGAFGMTMMVVSNVLVGGILTLAAPLLAVILREKVSRDVRKRALETAPQAVAQAEAAVKVKFDETIDDFSQKLSAFIATAGEELHRGILEVLQKVRRERAEAGFVRAEAEGRLEAQQDRLSEVGAKLAKLRERVWKQVAPPAADGPAEMS